MIDFELDLAGKVLVADCTFSPISSPMSSAGVHDAVCLERTLLSSLLSVVFCCSTVDDKDFCFILFSHYP
jgi:hypothetical protein